MTLGEKYFLWNSIPNLIWICGLIYYLCIRKSIGAVMVAMFVYLSLHGGYAIFAAATADGINTMNTLHYQSSDLGVKLVGAGFLIGCGIVLGFRMTNPWASIRGSNFFRLDIFLLLLLFLASMTYGAMNLPGITPGNLLTVLKESLFSICMWVGVLIFSVVIKQGYEYFVLYRKEWLSALIILGVIMITGGFYEIITGMVWAGTYYETGFSYRASGTLFNPNVLGFWSALMVLMVAFFFHLGWISRRITFAAMILVMGCLVLSSSRSGLVLSVVNLFAVSVIIFWRRKFMQISAMDQAWPLIAFLLAFILCAVVIEWLTPSPYAFLNTLHANLYRFLQLPVSIFWILMMKMGFPAMQVIEPLLIWLFGAELWAILTNSLASAASSYEGGKMAESVSGRMLLEYISDNSFMSIYAIGGVSALVIWLWLWAILFFMGVKKFKGSPGFFSAYALVGLIFCFVSGFFLRTPQLFPIWVFLSMLLGFCLSWWSPTANFVAATPNSSKPGLLGNQAL